MKEKDLQRKMRLALTKRVGGKWSKMHGGPYQNTHLDLLGCVKGLYIEIEVKMPGKERTLTRRQSRVIDVVQRNGGLSFMSTDVDTSVKLVRKWVKKQSST